MTRHEIASEMHQLTEKGIDNLTEDEFENLRNLYFMECSIERDMQEFAPEDKRDHYYNSHEVQWGWWFDKFIEFIREEESKNR